ncbi:GNAT family N-acetyltransferase [Sphingomonas sp.]|uniref:GNAT family N-acetyltransferase n=1 Tax=Sphingomonas sp. TaxID=28214 RepID=UPI003B3BC768
MSSRDADDAVPPDRYQSIFFSPKWQHVRYLGWRPARTETKRVAILERHNGPLVRRLLLSEANDPAELAAVLVGDGGLLRETIVHDFTGADSVGALLLQRGYHELGSDERLLNIATFVIDLRQDEDALHRALSTEARRMIRRAQQAGLLFEDAGEAALGGFHQAHEALATERNLRRLDQGLVRTMVRDGAARLFTVRTGSSCVAFALIYLADRSAFYLHGAATSRRDGIGYFLQWHSMLALRRDGIAWYDLGGVPTLDRGNGIHHFKREFGGQLVLLGREYGKSSGLFRIARRVKGTAR